ncbi:unnamed protein product, partial [Polarella glacialis]
MFAAGPRSAGAVRRIRINEDFPVQASKCGIALSWDQAQDGSRMVDLDLQGVVFNTAGKVVDAVYYNNMKALGRGLTHSGDETSGQKEGYDEAIWATLAALQPEVSLIVFVVACYRGGRIADAINGKVHILQDRQEVADFTLSDFGGQAAIIGSLRRVGSTWAFRVAACPVSHGQHFIDILEPSIGGLVREFIPSAPKKLKAAFAMDKGAVVDLPMSSSLHSTFAGLGWDVTMGEVDLDVSAVMLDSNCRELDCVFFGNVEAKGITHSGDNVTGKGAGDDEVITLDLVSIPAQVDQVMFIINIYSLGKDFSQVASPYCRLVSLDGDEFCRYELKEAGKEQ